MTPENAAKPSLFLIASSWLAYFSRASLRVPRPHAFHPHFAWECILVLHAVYLLPRFGRPDNQPQDVLLIGIEKTTRLVTKGVYRHVRHPLSSSLLFLAWGIFFKHPSWLAGL